MNWKLVAGLACGMALLLGACSGNPPATSSGTTSPPDANGGSNGDGDGDGGAGSTELQAANTAFGAAQTAVAAATAAATLAETAATEAARADARTKIAAARTALAAAVTAANAAHTAAAAGDDDAALGAAIQLRDRVTAYQTAQLAVLSTAESPLFWFTRALVRQAIADGEVQVPKENTNTAAIVRTARTKANAAGTAQIENTAPVPIKATTFKLVPYASGKKVFSSDAKHSGEETFKVDGYTNWLASNEAAHDTTTFTGLKLTGSGLVVRFGGLTADYPDTRMKLGTAVDTAGTDIGANGWDLAITFDDPQPLSGAKGVRSWQGNGDFYWKARVRPHASQLSGGANFVTGQMTAGRENLGVYEVWLSNHIGIDKGLEPVAGSSAPANPDDDTHLYLQYAAYGMFLYTADDGLVYTGYNLRKGRVQTINFGYTAFEDATGKRTTDINKAIPAGATFTGQTIAVAYRGDASDITPVAPPYPRVESKLLRGNVSLTVSIPKSTGTGTLSGTINGFETWDPSINRWTTGLTLQNPTMTAATGVATITAFHLNTDGSDGGTAVNIGNDGTFNGIAKAVGSNLENALGFHDGGSNDAGGVFKGNFYGPRTDTALEVAGSWRSRPAGSGDLDNDKWQISGSFGAKQKPAASSN